MVESSVWKYLLNPIFLTPGLLFLAWVLFRPNREKCRSRVRMDGKTVIVTGCTAGIGEATALDIAARGARVVLACRNVKKGHLVKKDIVKKTNNTNIVVMELDVSVMSSVRRFAEEFLSTEERLDVVIHNAGVVIPEKPVTDEGFNTLWATNYLGPFLLTHLLIDVLKTTRGGRIIFVSSTAHSLGKIQLNGNDFSQECKSAKSGYKQMFKTYCDTKFAQILFAKELARRLPITEVTVNALHPGFVSTSIVELNPILKLCLSYTISPFIKTPEEGAQTSIHLAVSEDLQNVSGKYFVDFKECAATPLTEDRRLAKDLWILSEELLQYKSSKLKIGNY